MADAIANTNDWWDNLSEEQKLHIIEGIEDAENGRTISSEEFWDRLKN
jgi:predicted transcriptional regulator